MLRPLWRRWVARCISRPCPRPSDLRLDGPERPKGAPAGKGLALKDEASLRQRLVNRDEQALVELIEVASPWLLGITQSMLSDPDEAEEVVLEVFTTAWERAGALGDQHETLLPWLLRIARNRAIDRLRRRAQVAAKARSRGGIRRGAGRSGLVGGIQ